MDFTALAQELVETTSSLVRGRTINVMDTEGVIIASTEKDRIGSIHEGAREVARTGKPVAIKKSQLACYPGAKEGYNMPIRNQDALIGVVGIYGNPNEITDAAHLLEVYVAKYFQLEAVLNQRLVEGELRGNLLRLLLSLTEEDRKRVNSILNVLQIRMEMPLRVVAISLMQEEQQESAHLLMGKLPEGLLASGILSPEKDIWGMADERLVIVKSGMAENTSAFRKTMEQVMKRAVLSCRVSIGSQCWELKEISASWQETILLDQCASSWFNDISDLDSRCQYMIFKAFQQERGFLASLYARLQGEIGQAEMDIMFRTIDCYYKENRSVAKAAAQLYIHKNTLQYRIHRMLDRLELSSASGFYQEFILRLLSWYHKCK